MKPALSKNSDRRLLVAMEIMSGLGMPGRTAWITHKETESLQLAALQRRGEVSADDVQELREQRISSLADSIVWLRQKAQDPEGFWRTLPVDFRTFTDSKMLLNKRGILWPRVVHHAMEINSGKYTECVLTGAIGVAKTTIALYSQGFQLYLLGCMTDPHAVFDLDPSSEIAIIFQSINKSLAKDVDYQRFRSMIADAPYFTVRFPFDQDRESTMRFPRNVVVKPVAGHDTASIGHNVIGGILDEVNYMAVVEDSKMVKGAKGVYDQAVENYNSIARRRESRFMQLGRLPGMLCLVSSRNYPGQFTDKKEEEARTNPHIYVYDKRLWELRPERYSGELFHVFVGDSARKPRILQEGEKVADQDGRLVIRVPVEHRRAFDNDLLKALRDIGGVATQAMHPFILNTDAIGRCFGRVQSIASREDCDFVDTRVRLYKRRIQHPDEPRFVHADLAVTGDNCGFCVGHVPGFMNIDRGDYKETLPVIQIDMVLAIMPPRGGEILFENVRKLIYALRELGVWVKWASFDTYQSTDSMQILNRHGVIAGVQSMDTDTVAYDVTKQALYDDRLRAPAHALAQKELAQLEIDQKSGKIDHPPHGGKDTSDALAGVTYGLTMRREIWTRHNIPLRNIPQSLLEMENRGKKSVTGQEQKQESYLERSRRAARERIDASR